MFSSLQTSEWRYYSTSTEWLSACTCAVSSSLALRQAFELQVENLVLKEPQNIEKGSTIASVRGMQAMGILLLLLLVITNKP